MAGIGDGGVRDVELAGEANELLGPAVRGERDDLEPVGMLAADIERLRADGSCAAEDGDARARV